MAKPIPTCRSLICCGDYGCSIMYREQYQKAHELAEQLLALAQRAQDPAFLLEAHLALGTTLHGLGEFLSSRKYMEQSIALSDPRQHSAYGLPLCWCRPWDDLPSRDRLDPVDAWVFRPGAPEEP